MMKGFADSYKMENRDKASRSGARNQSVSLYYILMVGVSFFNNIPLKMILINH